MSKKIELEDTLGEASSFVKALRLAADGMDNAVGCAIDVLAQQIELRLNTARDIIDDLREAV